MSTATNKARARRFVLEHNQAGYIASFDDLLAPDCIVHEYLPGLPDAMNRADYQQFIAMFRSAMPDIGNTIEDLIAEGDRVVGRYTVRGTHRGELLGIPPTGRQVTISATEIYRVDAGRIAEQWTLTDALGMMQQLGVIPAPDQ